MRGNWKYGGRFHGGWWQQINKGWREKIYINDLPTMELDYSAMHPHLLYGRERKQPPEGDMYAIDLKWEGVSSKILREWTKLLVLMLFNARTQTAGFQAFRNRQPTGSKGKRLKNTQLQQLLDAFKEKHPPLKKYLGKDAGVTLMQMDGNIAATVINTMTKEKRPVLSIHDSFITTIDDVYRLSSVMKDAVETVAKITIPTDQYNDYLPEYIKLFKSKTNKPIPITYLKTRKTTDRYNHLLNQWRDRS